MESKHPKKQKYTNKGRQYNSRRNASSSSKHNVTKRRRSRRIANKQKHDAMNGDDDEDAFTPKSIQNPVIVNGCCDHANKTEHSEHGMVEVHGSASPAFMPSVNGNNYRSHHSAANRSTFSLDTHSSMTSMEMDDEYNWNDGQNMNVGDADIDADLQMDEFNMIGMDGFDHLGVFGALSRNSSNSMNEINLNSAFTDPSSFTFGQSQNKKDNFDHNAVKLHFALCHVFTCVYVQMM